MKKNILALAVGAAVTALTVPAMAADVTVSGRAHMSVDQMTDGKDATTDVSSNSSRIRFSGKTEVAEGLTAMMQLEQTINFDQRTKEDVFTSRDSFFGLKGDFGMVRLGYFDTPLKKVRSRTDMFGDRVGDARNITSGGGMKNDERFHNSIHYQSPSFSGLTFDFQYSGDNKEKADPRVKGRLEAYSTSLTFKADGLLVIGAYEKKGDGVSGNNDPETIRLGATYNVAKGFKVAGLFQDYKLKNDADDKNRTVMGLGAYYDLGEYRLRAQYYMAGETKAKKDDANLMAVGVDRKFGKDLTLYAVYGSTTNGKNTDEFLVTAGGHGSSLDPVEDGKTVSAISLGAIYNF